MSLAKQLALGAICLIAVNAEQPSAPSAPSSSLRELPWGQLNFLHTTDTHGWFAGHLNEAQYSADWGDYISFAHHLRQRADDDGSDLLVVDTGDRVEGNGLYDASTPQGKYLSDIIKMQKMDVITSGNHELYIHNTSAREYDETVPNFKDSYIASNIDYITEAGDRKPLAARFRRFTTKNQRIRVLAFGFLFNFHGNAENTVVQNVEDTIKEDWFKDALREKDVDLYVVAGHVPVRNSPETKHLYEAIRTEKWDTPIVFLGGHTHIRDYQKFDKKAWALESGRYMETIGFLSISGLDGEKKKDNSVGTASSVDFKRLYIDNNLYSLHHHSGKNKSTFATAEGKNVSEEINKARNTLNLDHAFGCAPTDYWLNRAPYPSNDSLVTLFETQILPEAFKQLNRPLVALVNTGALRFDVFKGPFTIDSTYLISPFTSGFRLIKDVPLETANQVLKLLNQERSIWFHNFEEQGATAQQLPSLRPALPAQRLSTELHMSRWSAVKNDQQLPIGSSGDGTPLIPGYTTHDAAGDDGDDTIHAPIKFYGVPNCVGPGIGFDTSENAEQPETVDLAYNEFLESYVLLALKYLGKSYTKEDTASTLDGESMTSVLSKWVEKNWPCSGS